MSAAQRTPGELWTQIHAFIAHYPERTHYAWPWLEDKPDDGLKEYIPFVGVTPPLVEHRQNILAVQGTCRAWRDSATPLLHRTLVLESLSRLVKVADHLEQSRKHRLHGLGWWTKELVVTMGTYGNTAGEHQSAGHNLARIVRCCPQLRTFISFVATMQSEAREVVDALPSTIRHMHWVSAGPSFRSWHSLITRAESILSLRMTSLYVSQDVSETPHLCLEALHTLYLNGAAPGVPGLLRTLVGWDLPSLRTVVLTNAFNMRTEPDATSFFERFGSQITAVAYPNSLGSRDVSERLARLISTCTGLRHLWLSQSLKWRHNETTLLKLSTVTHVALQSSFQAMIMLPPDRIQGWGEVLSMFDAEHYPALQVIRFSSVTLPDLKSGETEVATFWENAIATAKAQGVELQDAYGVPLKVEKLHSTQD